MDTIGSNCTTGNELVRALGGLLVGLAAGFVFGLLAARKGDKLQSLTVWVNPSLSGRCTQQWYWNGEQWVILTTSGGRYCAGN